METNQQIQQLLAELGPASGDIVNVVETGDNTWGVEYGDGTVFLLELDAAQAKLVFSTDLGRPEESRQLEVYSALLGFNFLWRETGGVTMALGDGELTQLFGLTATDLSLDLLQTVSSNFKAKADVFRAFVARTGAAPDTAVDDFAMLRV